VLHWPGRIPSYCSSFCRMKGKRLRNVAQVKARWLVHEAIASGRLIRQFCQRCGGQPAEGHHHDYSKPLDVVWLCGACHRREHAACSS
jgi:ribosomal protein S27AE